MSVDVLVVGLLGLGALVAPLLLVGLLVALAVRRPPSAPDPADTARRHGILVNLLAWLAVVIVAPVTIGVAALMALRTTGGSSGYAGVVAGCWLAGHTLVFLAVHAVGERTWPRPSGLVRRAALAPRPVALPRRMLAVTVAWAGTLLVVLTATGLTAVDGQRLVGTSGAAASPYPGWHYGLPLVLALLLTSAATWGTLGLIARRPAVVDADPELDATSRRLSAHRVLRGVQLALALTLAAVLWFTGQALVTIGLAGAGIVATAAAVLAALGGLAVAAVPGPSLVRQVAAPPMGAPGQIGVAGASR